MSNPFLEPYHTLHDATPFDRIQLSDYEPAMREGMRQEDEEIQQIINNPETPTFANTILALEHAGKLLDKVTTVFFNLISAETCDEMDAIAEKMMPELSEHGNNISLNEKLFARVKEVYNQKENLQLNPEESKLLENAYNSFVRHGANLEGEAREEYRNHSEGRLSADRLQG